MSGIIDDPRHWRARAEESRALADCMMSPETRKRLHAIARDYDALAVIAEKRAGAQHKLDGGDKG